MNPSPQVTNLRIPGPTPVPPEVRQALAAPVIGHRSADMQALMSRVRQSLRQVFQSEHEVLFFAASGTGGMEAAVANLLSPGDRVLVVSVGVFGERWIQLVEAFGAEVDCLRFPPGEAADPGRVAARLRTEGPYRAVFATHNETSTGVTNDLEALSGALQEQGDERPLLVVDAISSLGAIDLRTDAWECDVVVTGSQKALMTPPGLALVSVSPRALAASEQARNPRFYWDFHKALQYATERNQTPFTPSVSLLQGLDVALEQILAEGLQNCPGTGSGAVERRDGPESAPRCLCQDPHRAAAGGVSHRGGWGPRASERADLPRGTHGLGHPPGPGRGAPGPAADSESLTQATRLTAENAEGCQRIRATD